MWKWFSSFREKERAKLDENIIKEKLRKLGKTKKNENDLKVKYYETLISKKK